MKKLWLLALLVLASCAESIISVKPSKIPLEDISNNYDVYGYYYLPKTILKLRIPVYKKKYKAGLIKKGDDSCLAKLVKTNFGWEPLEKPKDDEFGIDNGTIISSIFEPDFGKHYAILYKNSKAISQTLNISINKDGIIQSGEFAQESKAYDITKKSIELVGTAISSTGGLGLDSDSEDEDKEKIPCSTIEEIQNQRGKILVDRAFKLLKAKYDLIKDYPNQISNTDVQKFHLKKVDEELKVVKGELIGSVSKKIHYITLFIDPKENFDDLTLLEINPNEGIIDQSISKSTLLSSGIKTTSKVNKKALKLIVQKKTVPNEAHFLSSEATMVTIEGKTKIKGEAFLHYNVPAKYTLSLKYGDKKLTAKSSAKDKTGQDDFEIYFPQLGQVAYLNKDFKEANVVYYEDTGGLKSAKISRGGDFNAERVEGIFTALDSIYSTAKALKEKNEEEEEETATSEEVEEIEEQVIRLIIENNSLTSDNS